MSIRRVISLFDESGNMVRPWAAAGYHCMCFDILNEVHDEFVGNGVIQFYRADLSSERTIQRICEIPNVCFAFGFPPCTHLSVAGNRHLEAKRQADPVFQQRAVELCRTVETVGNELKVTWMAENPRSMLTSLWRPSDYTFHPHEYGGYLPIDDVHPRFPKYIPPRDMYRKTTNLWTSDDFIMPPPIPVPFIDLDGFAPQMQALGGDNENTKKIRAETPRGFAEAAFVANGLRFE